MPHLTDARCLDTGDGACAGNVEYHSTDPGVRPSFPRCARHWAARLVREAEYRVNYPDSPLAPAWFDPLAAGERWDDDY